LRLKKVELFNIKSPFFPRKPRFVIRHTLANHQLALSIFGILAENAFLKNKQKKMVKRKEKVKRKGKERKEKKRKEK
jgi:hypothetical protein